jgi:hypothetical protein
MNKSFLVSMKFADTQLSLPGKPYKPHQIFVVKARRIKG